MRDVLLDIRNLRTHFYTEDGVVKAINGVNLEIARGETLGLVGESGSGKSVTALSILRLIQDPPGKIVSGQLLFKGEDLLTYPIARLRREIRGREIAMIFQDPMISLNPVFSVGNQLAEAIYLHQFKGQRAALRTGLAKLREAGAPALEEMAEAEPARYGRGLWQQAVQRGIRMMEAVGIPSARDRVIDYPHQFSGGMRQRIMIAMAISCNPSLLIADEPSTALDVTIQAQILEIMKTIKRQFGTAILLITHNLGVVAEMADRVAVMYAGNIVEYTDAHTLFFQPKHPYTVGLLNCYPEVDGPRKQLESIEGVVPDLINPPSGCRFHPRCKHAMPICRQQEPQLKPLTEGHLVSCHLYETATTDAATTDGHR
ncbi:MAG: ABC transporter ATP-binding protein [Nitrospinae bacterium]|nr:ABC transporter ATP-binding protein [Nitrospinota bacterium]